MTVDVTEATFDAAVIARSHELPVVVDFWAQWCGPCRQLGPVLERAVVEREGKVELVKVDTDSNQQLARTFGIQGIPAVKAFVDGAVVAEFVGAQPPQAVAGFLDALLPSEVDGLLANGDEVSLRKAVELEPRRADAALPLARLLHARGETDDAQAVLQNLTGSFAADGLLARIALEHAADTSDLRDAFAALDSRKHELALDLLLGALLQTGSAKDDIRKVIVGVLDELGPESELARTARRRLATALY
jgi:putative thioredoxin